MVYDQHYTREMNEMQMNQYYVSQVPKDRKRRILTRNVKSLHLDSHVVIVKHRIRPAS